MASRILAQAGPSTIYHVSSASHRGLSGALLTWPKSKSPFRKSFSTTSRARASQNSSAGSGAQFDIDKTKGETHYETLGIPHSASRMEIKAAYFRLSKRYHPDVRRNVRPSAKEGGGEGGDINRKPGVDAVGEEREKEAEKRATERFHEVSAAYRVLSDDRQRRAYDRSIASSPHVHRSRAPPTHAHTPGSSHSHAYTYELHSRRKRGATHAWENTAHGPRAFTGRSHTHAHTSTHPQAHASASGAGRHYDPTSSPFAQTQAQSTANNPNPLSSSSRTDATSNLHSERLSGRALRAQEEREAHDRIIRESNVARFFRALGIVLIVTWVGSLGKTLGS